MERSKSRTNMFYATLILLMVLLPFMDPNLKKDINSSMSIMQIQSTSYYITNAAHTHCTIKGALVKLV